MYQKAGLFAEAGRVRQTYLENDKPMVQIGQIGDSVVKDSVIMSEQKSTLSKLWRSNTTRMEFLPIM